MNKARIQAQKEAVSSIKKHNNVILKWGTGVGKSYAFIQMQEYLKAKKVFIVVAETAHILNWEDEYKKHNKKHLLKDVEIFCYASLHKYEDAEVDLICLDEGHRALTDRRIHFLKSIKTKKRVLLSATIKSNQIDYINYSLGTFYTHIVSLQDAIKTEILPEPTIYLVPIRFPKGLTTVEITWGRKNKRKTIYCEYKDRFKYISHKKKYPHIKLIVSCTYYQKNEYYNSMINFYRNRFFISRQIFFKHRWLQLGSERKRFLAEAKTSTVQEFLPKIKDKRFICFTGSINQANTLSKNKNVIHSKIKDTTSIIKAFNEEQIDNLFVVNMLKEGQNLNNIEVGVIVQLDGDVGPFIQKSGRVMRAENPEIFIFYYEDTRDIEYLNKILEVIEDKHFKVISNIEEFKSK